ncbi:MAG: acetyl-CoA C-acetyltransferase [Candidatus Eremiobacteraeota bacterium]|nr:acetyl-CoA C-acetyltransferase [Candidatus Eremiobacteraeota bacterium]MBC5826276.1 acetyl-CoA C-acetyltransferase [Candidatus Eremiobacteraeota bacterium]
MGKDIVIVDGARTPFGNFGGALRDVSAIDLAVVAGRAAMKRSGVAPEKIDHVIFGNVMHTSADAIYGARHVGLKAGCREDVPALTVNRLCGSGLQAIITGAQQILLGEADFVLAGGMENMSQSPHVIRGARWGLTLGQGKLEDALWEGLTDSYNGLPMAMTAENLAERYEITREEADEFSLTSQRGAAAAASDGFFAAEIAAVDVKGPKGATLSVEKDEGPRSGVTMEQLAKLPPRFKKDGIVTPGNASGITDGAAAVVLTSAARAEKDGLKPLGRLVAWGIVGVDPDVMGIGPAFAIPAALERAKMSLDDIDVVEINEAFAPQVLACVHALHLDGQRLNPNGGAIALGHPLGASGARLAYTLLNELRRKKKKYGVASACIGGGQGIAGIVEAY